MWSFANLSRRHHHNRNESHGVLATNIPAAKRTSELAYAGIHKGAAVGTALLAGGIGAYKGIPEIKGFAGFDLLGGLALSAAEAVMLYKGKGGKLTATIGGTGTGLLCYYAATQGTLWGAQKARQDAATKGFNYDAKDAGLPAPSAPPVAPPAAKRTGEFLG